MGLLDIFKRSTYKTGHVKDMTPDDNKSTGYVSMMMGDFFRNGMVDGGNYQSMARDGYMTNGTAFSAIRMVSQCSGAVPWALFTGNGDDRERVESHDLLNLWNRPNSKMGNAQFIEWIVSYLHIGGEAFVTTTFKDDVEPGQEFRSRGARKPETLMLLRPDTVSFSGGIADSDVKWNSPSGVVVDIPREEVLHLRLFHPLDDVHGLSPLQVSSLSIDQSNLAKIWNKSLMRKAGRPGSILRSKYDPPKAVKDQILERFRDEVAGSDNAGDAIFLSGDLEWERASLSPEEASWVEGQKLSLRDISVTQGAPSQLNGDTDSTTYSNYQEARKALYQERVLPILNFIRDEFNVWLTPRYGEGLMLDIVKKDIDALQEDRSSEWDRLKKADWLTINEKRKSVGLHSVPDERADVPIILLSSDPETVDVEVERGIVVPNVKEIKAFNLGSDVEIEFHWKQIEAARRSLMPQVRARLGKQFKDERDHMITELFRTESPLSVIDTLPQILDRSRDGLTSNLLESYQDVSVKFARTVIRKLPTNRVPTEFLLSEVRQDAADYFNDIADLKISQIHKTTQKRVSDSIIEGIELNENVDEMAVRINREMADRDRLRMIAETETRAASNLGAQRGAAHSGFDSMKRWVTELDGRAREHHSFANGQERAIEEPYVVNGELLQFPGDSTNASASNIIRCRCTESYVIVE